MNQSDLARNAYLLSGSLSKKGYMRWFHSFNAVQLQTGEQRVFFIEYLIMNPSLGQEIPVLGQLPFHRKRGIRPSYIMIKAGAFGGDGGSVARQLHAFFPITSLKVAFKPFILQAGGNFLSEQRIRGFVSVSHDLARRRSYMCDEGDMEWDLELNKSISCHTGRIANPLHCAINALETFWHAEGIMTQYRGHVTLDGVTYEVTDDESFGYADKHWGSSFNHPWLQLASCRLISERTGKILKHSALAVDGCCPRFLFFPLKRKLLLQLTYEGEDFSFFLTQSEHRSKWKVRKTNKRLLWQVVAQSRQAVVKLSVNSYLDEMLEMNYEDPNGHRPELPLLEGGTGLGVLQLYRRTREGKELVDTITLENVLCAYGAE